MRIYNKIHIPDEEDDIMSINDWLLTKNIFISNEDGHGYYMKNNKICTTEEVFSHEPLDATHVIWYNK